MTYFNALQHTATNPYMKTLASVESNFKNIFTGCHAVQHTATYCKHTVTHYITLQLTATHCTSLQHTTPHCNILQYTATHWNTLQHKYFQEQRQENLSTIHCNSLQPAATHYNALQHTATHCNTLQHTLQRTVTHYNTLQHTATHCNTLCLYAGNRSEWQLYYIEKCNCRQFYCVKQFYYV